VHRRRFQGLLSVLISNWLTIVDVARLDSAICKHEARDEFLNVAYRVGVPLQNQAGITINNWAATASTSGYWLRMLRCLASLQLLLSSAII
jgi:hypothetical protein